MSNLSNIEVFLEVVKQNSFSHAAKCLDMSAPAVSKHVKTLEKRLGVTLLNRTTRKLTLTEEGAIYSNRAKRALDDLHESEKQILDLKTCPTGSLRINAPFSFGIQYLTKPIAQFARRYPDVLMDVNFDDRYVDIIEEGYDVVIRIADLKDSTLIARKLADCPILLCASPDYLKTHGRPETPDDVEAMPGVVYSKHDNRSEWRYSDSTGKTGKVKMNRDFAANNAESMAEACLQGLGMALLPVFVAAPYLKSDQLIHILDGYQTHPQLAIYAVYPQNRYLSTKVRLFIDWIIQSCQRLPW